ncbi:unnamed protein product [Pleuronectes platessa]|uniref:Uncharacterized protein n=1 Tax=Pleuronectes platessa TaxID=8262 RepID=A0A9N7YNJ9_PLEPL|nr:unnamed protein product [Pleuronectes platessa]
MSIEVQRRTDRDIMSLNKLKGNNVCPRGRTSASTDDALKESLCGLHTKQHQAALKASVQRSREGLTTDPSGLLEMTHQHSPNTLFCGRLCQHLRVLSLSSTPHVADAPPANADSHARETRDPRRVLSP